MSDIDNNQDVIDSRDVIARIEELQGERESLRDYVQEARDEFLDLAGRDYDDMTADEIEADAKLTVLEDQILGRQAELDAWDRHNEGQELADLEALAEEAKAYAADWQYGEMLIRDSYFKEYAQQLAEDIGAINRDTSWPNSCIDWDEAVEELQQDYTAVNFAGVTYWVR